MITDEHVLRLLPATRESLVAKRPGVSPDVLLWRLASLHRVSRVRKRWDGVYLPVEEEKEAEASQRVRRGNPNPKPRTTSRTCEICGTTYAGVRKHFGTNAKHCRSCRGRARSFGQTKDKTCPSCGVTYRGIVDNFKRAGRVRSTCNSCGEREVRERIAMRRAKA